MENKVFLDGKAIIYNSDVSSFLNEEKDCSIDLAILDPPYWRVVNEKWDRQCKTEEDYICWVRQWSSELFQKMRYGGSIYLFGYFRTLSKLVSPLQSIGYQLRQQIVIDKGLRAVSGRATKDYKIFPNVTESCLLLIKDPYLYVKQILLDAKKANKFSSKEINEKIGVKSNGGGMWSIYTGENICRQIPTKEIWDKFSDVFQLKIDYCKISQTFNPIKGLTDVWTDINFYEEDRIHPTQKPLKLIKRLIQTSSNEGDLIVDPFLGSSSSVIASIDMGREIHGCEKNKEYFDKSVERIEKVIQARK